MADCNFSISFSQDPSDLVNKAKAAIEKQGGVFNGDATSGSFRVKIMGTLSGSYTITENQMNINIDAKPIFISCGQIESFMKAQFGSWLFCYMS